MSDPVMELFFAWLESDAYRARIAWMIEAMPLRDGFAPVGA